MRHKNLTSLFLLATLLLATLCATQAIAEEPDSLTVTYSRHGTAPGATHRTLAIIDLSGAQNSPEISVELLGETSQFVSSYRILLSDSLATRDLDDYRGRITYRAFPCDDPHHIKLTAPQFKAGRYLYLTADIRPEISAEELPRIGVRVSEIRSQGQELPIREVNRGDRTIYPIYQTLFVPGDTGSRNFRIPALIRTRRGTLIAVADRRKNNDRDLPEDIDIILRRSTDGGKSWSVPQIVVEGKGYEKGFGDAAVVECRSGKLLMVFVGGRGFWESTSTDSNRTYLCESTDDGITWSKPRDITPMIFGADCPDPVRKQWRSSFFASGKGLCTREGRIIFVAAIRENDRWSANNYAFFSDDEGESWHISTKAFDGGDEAKVAELPNGDLLMSIRNKHHGDRFFAVSHDHGETWTGTARYAGLFDPAVNGAPLVIRYGEKDYLLHSLPAGPGRRNGLIRAFDLYEWKWISTFLANPGPSAYSDLILLDDDHLGYFMEEDWEMSLIFYKIPLRAVLKEE